MGRVPLRVRLKTEFAAVVPLRVGRAALSAPYAVSIKAHHRPQDHNSVSQRPVDPGTPLACYSS
jgi:hypothetical protein